MRWYMRCWGKHRSPSLPLAKGVGVDAGDTRAVLYYVDLRGARSSVTPLRLVRDRVLWSGQLEAGALWRVRSGTTLEIHVARSQECTRKAERTAALLEKLTVLDEALLKAPGVQAIANLADHNDARIWDQSHKRLVGKLQQHARQMHPSRLLTPMRQTNSTRRTCSHRHRHHVA